MRTVWGLAVLAAMACPAVAEQTSKAAKVAITGEDPALIQRLMQDLGYRAQLTKDGRGDPLIRSASMGVNYAIYFYGCKNGTKCSEIQFSAAFDLVDGTSMAVINEWNISRRYGKAYLDEESDPFLDMDVNLWGGGISPATFKDDLEIWNELLVEFRAHLGL